MRLLSRFNDLPDGVEFLVDMRAELLTLAQGDPNLQEFDDEFRELLASWFDVGFLELRRITWDSPASLLERLATQEAVHAVESWSDIKNRLAPDRRCYAFFHAQMPDEPLIYMWVALVKGMSDNVQVLLDVSAPTRDPADADTALFYSISNAQPGLAGVSLGTFLIKRVVDHLARDLAKIKTYATLSPIPGFAGWLHERIEQTGDELLTADELSRLQGLMPDLSGTLLLDSLAKLDGWFRQDELRAAVKSPLMRLCAQYLTKERRGHRARDRVAHFHLSNGARIERINWLGDTSAKGMRESLGIMANYLYRARDIEKNHEAYRGGGIIKTSSRVGALLRKGGQRRP
jgi:malonyl-CoA decarboxylase